MEPKRTPHSVLSALFIGSLLLSCGVGNDKAPAPEPEPPLDEPQGMELPIVDVEQEDPEGVLVDARPAHPLSRDGVNYVTSDTPDLPRVRYLDGQVGLSESCVIKMGNKLSRQVPPAYVNGQPIGFC